MQEWFVPSLIEIGQKILSKIHYVKIVSPLAAPPDPQGPYNLYKPKSAICQKAFM
jgi:hypothetical protein